mgnify:CR=1 FL=1
MKKLASVFALYCRHSVLLLLLVFLALAAADLAGFYLLGGSAMPSFSGDSFGQFVLIAFFAAFWLCVAALLAPYNTRARYGYTLQRLQISERTAFFLHIACNALCIFCLYAFQIVLLWLLSRLYQSGAGYAEGVQGVYVDFYRSAYLHSLLPLGEWLIWLRNLVYVLTAGILTAYMPLGMRCRAKSSAAAILLCNTFTLRFKIELGGSAFCIIQILGAAFLAGVFLVMAFGMLHDGVRRAEDYEN